MRKLKRQTGVVLAVSLLMLALLTIIGVSAITLSTNHFRLVGNLQAANEADMAIRAIVERYACERSGSVCLPINRACQRYQTCVNGHAVEVEIRTQCIGASRGQAAGGSISNPNPVFDTHWDIHGTVTQTGASAHLGLALPKGGPCPAPTTPTCTDATAVTCN
ncbi:MAG: hypothetical protein ACKN9W_08260 [Methylococcus sp.]